MASEAIAGAMTMFISAFAVLLGLLIALAPNNHNDVVAGTMIAAGGGLFLLFRLTRY